MMAVRAVGIDLVGVAEFASQLGSVGSAFAERTFTAGELRASGGSAGAAQHLAGRYAAKEAFVKAFSGARPGRAPVAPDMDWREVEVVTDGWGRPVLALHGALAQAVAATLGPVTLHVSLTHEPTMAAAVVVIEDRAERA
jgi:holo-[acyl-carrier protein] synthase